MTEKEKADLYAEIRKIPGEYEWKDEGDHFCKMADKLISATDWSPSTIYNFLFRAYWVAAGNYGA